jgi:predicted RNA polymerase sigma factor
MAQRISRATSAIKSSGAEFELPTDAATDQRLASVVHVPYLIFNEGFTTSSGAQIQRFALAEEAIRLTRMLARLTPRRRGPPACSR